MNKPSSNIQLLYTITTTSTLSLPLSPPQPNQPNNQPTNPNQNQTQTQTTSPNPNPNQTKTQTQGYVQGLRPELRAEATCRGCRQGCTWVDEQQTAKGYLVLHVPSSCLVDEQTKQHYYYRALVSIRVCQGDDGRDFGRGMTES